LSQFDVIVVGAGPTGLACGIELQRRGVNTVLFDKGCVVNSLYHYPTNMTFFTTPELLEIGDIPMTSLGDKPVRVEALKYYRRVAEHYRVNIHQYEGVDSIGGQDGGFSVCTTDRTGARRSYNSRKVILATGFYDRPNLLKVPGEDLPKVLHYYKEAHPYWALDVAVVGGKNSACIAALELHWAGARVTLIHRRAELSPNVKYWIKPNIENRIKSSEIKGYFNSHITQIRPDSITVQTPSGLVDLNNDFVFAMTGYHPDLELLASVGITLDPASKRPYTNPDTLESHRPGVYLAGVIVAGMHTNEIFIENGRFHGAMIARDIAAKLEASRIDLVR
jgi:thioredoxin reductase (NADPH)